MVSTFVDYICVSCINQIKKLKLKSYWYLMSVSFEKKNQKQEGRLSKRVRFVITAHDTVIKRTRKSGHYCV